MKRRLFKIYLTAVALTAVMAFLSLALLIFFRVDDQREALRSALESAGAWTIDAHDDLQTHARRIAEVSPPLRVTFMLDSGLVLADSAGDVYAMDDHFGRPEVEAALRGEVGESLRFSSTQNVYMLYAAKLIAPHVVLRLAYPIEMITHALITYGVGIAILFVALQMILRRSMRRMSELLVRQMDDVRVILEDGGEPKQAVFPELQPALDNIAYRAKRLSSDMAEISRTLKLRNNFVANASHELCSPLTSIMGFAEMLDEGLADTPEERELCVKAIRSECERMLGVVEDVLQLSRAERQGPPSVEDVDVAAVAGEVVRALEPQAAQKNIAMHIKGGMTVRACEKDVWEILHNLVGNAIRYGRPGGLVYVDLSGQTVSVVDDGIGIAKEHLPHLFEQFYRVDQSRDNAGGTGLGLSIVRTLAERNGACVDVTSAPGEGSTFTVTFTQPPAGEGKEAGA